MKLGTYKVSIQHKSGKYISSSFIMTSKDFGKKFFLKNFSIDFPKIYLKIHAINTKE